MIAGENITIQQYRLTVCGRKLPSFNPILGPFYGIARNLFYSVVLVVVVAAVAFVIVAAGLLLLCRC